MKRGLEPIIDKESRVLILGTLPGDVSLQYAQYYADSRNKFWTILSAVYEETIPPDYPNRLRFLRKKRIALWDVLHSANRRGSLDRDIKNAVPNDFSRLLRVHRNIAAIALNGKRAWDLFSLHVQQQLTHELERRPRLIRLPSTSGMPGKYISSIDQKIDEWRVIASL